MSPLAGTEAHPHARAVLGAALPPRGAPSHAYLFSGPAGTGKARVARAFAAALLSEDAPDPDSAVARVASGAHPDLTWVAPRSSAGILRGDVDEAVVAAAARTPFESRRRVFVVERADELNDQAANRLLKTLEEPPAFAHLILLTSRASNVLPTIASRCQLVRFDAPSAETIAGELEAQGVEPGLARACARLALGDVDRARRLALGDGAELRAAAEVVARGAISGELAGQPWSTLLERAKAAGDDAAGELRTLVQADLDLLPQKERRKSEREGEEDAKRAHRRAASQSLDQGLQLVGLWLRDAACVCDGAEELVHNADRIEPLRADAAGASVHRLRAGVALVDEARASLALNPSEELALEALAYRLAAELAER